MRQVYIVTAVFLFWGVFSVNAQDLIVLKNGNIVDAKVIEISPTEIMYKRFDHLDGPTIVLPAANVMSIRYENGSVEIINTGPAAKAKSTAMDPNRRYFGLSADPSGFLLYGPSILIEYTKGTCNAQFYLSFPSIGLLVQAEGSGIGFGVSLNYLWHTRTGAFYFGGLIDYSGYEVEVRRAHWIYDGGGGYTTTDDSEYLWQSNLTFALNLGYKFVLSSGVYFTTGGSLGVTTIAQDGYYIDDAFIFFLRPNIALGYNF